MNLPAEGWEVEGVEGVEGVEVKFREVELASLWLEKLREVELASLWLEKLRQI